MPPKKRAAEESSDSSSKQSKTEPEESEPTKDVSKPYTGFVFVITGNFPMSSDMIERRIIGLGGKVASAVAKSTTHLMLGDSGTTMYGQKTGQGSKKYKEAKKRKCIVITYPELNDAETAAQASGSTVGAVSKLQPIWDELVSVIQAGADKNLWEMPTFKPPATLEEIGEIEKEFQFRLGKYTDLLLITNGCTAYFGKHTTTSLTFGGTGDGEDDLRHAFNYSGEEGCRHFRRKKQVPYHMIDYDFCVNVFETGSGCMMQDDRECGSYRHLAPSISSWLTGITKDLRDIVSKPIDTTSTVP